MNNIQITIITPCMNSRQTIAKTMDSVLNQTYKNYQYIVADGNSQDGTVAIIQKYEPLFQGKMIWTSQKDAGIADAWNRAAAKATGDLVVFLGADDELETTALEHIAAAYDPEKPLAVYYGMMRTMRDGQETGCIMVHHRELPRQMIAFPACFISRKAIEKFGEVDTQYRIVTDYAYMLKLFQSGEVEFIPVYQIVSRFNVTGLSNMSFRTGIETAQVQYKGGYISKKSYYKNVLKAYIKGFFKKIIKA